MYVILAVTSYRRCCDDHRVGGEGVVEKTSVHDPAC